MVTIHRLPLLPTNHLTSLYIGPPVNMYVSNNTFMKYRVGDSEYVGLVTNVNASTARMVVWKFLSWDQLIQEVPQARIEGISFWPCSNKPPFLCDTDLVADIESAAVVSIVFVFYEGDNRLRELLGVKDTFCVSSCYYSRSRIFEHHCSFFPFPSSWAASMGIYLPSCLPSLILNQMLTIKNRYSLH
jgi:hypothetical protein